MHSRDWKRIVVIGDVHGCIRELCHLLDKLAPGLDDLVLFTGDLIRKGPDSAAVLHLVNSQPHFFSVRGNGEEKFLQKRAHVPTLTVRDRQRVRDWPVMVSWDGNVLVHAGVHPHRPLERQRYQELLTLRSLHHGSDYRPPFWFEHYSGKRRVIFGHTVSRKPILAPCAVGLDTGCVYGGHLTAYDTTNDRFISVPGRHAYQGRAAWGYYTP